MNRLATNCNKQPLMDFSCCLHRTETDFIITLESINDYGLGISSIELYRYITKSENQNDIQLLKNATTIDYTFECLKGCYHTPFELQFDVFVSSIECKTAEKSVFSISLKYPCTYPYELIAKHICGFQNIRVLKISPGSIISSTEMKILQCGLSSKFNQIHTLEFGSMRFFTDEGCNIFLDVLKNNTTITKLKILLWYSDNQKELDSKECEILAKTIKRNTTITYFQWSNFRCNGDGLKIIANALKYNNVLKTLNIEFNDATAIIEILKGLRFNCDITHLICSIDYFNENLMHAFINLLRVNASISKLNSKFDPPTFTGGVENPFYKRMWHRIHCLLDENQHLCIEKNRIIETLYLCHSFGDGSLLHSMPTEILWCLVEAVRFSYCFK